jgi:hypothetical protein
MLRIFPIVLSFAVAVSGQHSTLPATNEFAPFVESVDIHAAHPDKEGREFYLSVGAVFRDEDDFLAEWLEFHLCAGVEHFFLYNHFSATDKHEEILRPYISAGLVTLDQAVCDVHCQACFALPPPPRRRHYYRFFRRQSHIRSSGGAGRCPL